MQPTNVPRVNARYWTLIVLASIFGTNCGDFFAHVFGLGHVLGLLPLAAVFTAILLVERRGPTGTDAYYWLAIVTLRTAATNLADFATHDLRLAPALVIAGLALLLVGVLLTGSGASAASSTGPAPFVPTADARFWVAMAIAGTLGTAAGDAAADNPNLGVGMAALVFMGLLAIVLLLRRRRDGVATKLSYWVAVALVRTAGTDIGDFLAGKHGLHLGLPISTALTATVMLVAWLAWKPASGSSGGVAAAIT